MRHKRGSPSSILNNIYLRRVRKCLSHLYRPNWGTDLTIEGAIYPISSQILSKIYLIKHTGAFESKCLILVSKSSDLSSGRECHNIHAEDWGIASEYVVISASFEMQGSSIQAGTRVKYPGKPQTRKSLFFPFLNSLL